MGNPNKSVEVEGANVKEAINKALKILEVARDSINVKIVCEEQKGLFGMGGAKPAKIKVSLKKSLDFSKEKRENIKRSSQN